MKYGSTSTRWQVIVFDYINNYPIDEAVEDTVMLLSNLGVVSISFSRSKATIQSTASIEIVGSLSPEYRIGNWLVIKSKVGAFKETDKISLSSEGVVRFIGQIVDVTTTYNKAANGLFHRRSSVIVREWSGVLHCPVRLEFGAAEQAALQSSKADLQLEAIKKADKNNGNMIEIAQSVFDPFDYVRLVLAFVGFFGSSFKGTGPDFSDPKNKALMPIAKEISRTALNLPHIPKKLLTYLGMTDVEPDQAFTSNGGFAGLILGVNNGDTQITETYRTKNKDKTFDGRFASFVGLQDVYKNYKDRPKTTGMLSDFSQGRGAWDLLKARCDGEFNECFTDIWYFGSSETEMTTSFSSTDIILPTDRVTGKESDIIDPIIIDDDSLGSFTPKSPIYAKPVLIVRDKPFAMAKYLKLIEIKSSKWSTLDNVPRVRLSDTYIKSINVKSTFFNSPNYIQPTIANDITTDTFASKNLLLLFALRTVRPEMNRFGGIQHFPQTPYIGQNTSNEDIATEWFKDASKIQYLWHSLNYRYLSGTINIKDNDVALMVGCNVVFTLKNGLRLCAHVESLSWNFSISPDGQVSNDCQIGFSYMCRVMDDDSLDFISGYDINDLFANEFGSRAESTPFIDKIARTDKEIAEILKQQQEEDKKKFMEKKKTITKKKKKDK